MNKRILKYYCESCEEVCCEYCLTQGHHNNKLHVVDYLIFYHEKRVELFKKLISEKLGSKKQKIFD